MRFAVLLLLLIACPAWAETVAIQSYPLPKGTHPHDVAPAPDGRVWYTAQNQGALGRLDPSTGKVEHIPLGEGSRPHGVIVGADGLAWVTDSGLNAMVSVHPQTRAVKRYPLPKDATDANLNTAAFDGNGILWFTGQSGVYGRLDPKTGDLKVFPAPGGAGPYGIDATPDGQIWYASLAGNHIARIDSATGKASVVEPPTSGSGPRRIWSDSKGMLWVSQWNVGQLARYDPAVGQWTEWKLPGRNPSAYSVYVDDADKVWVSDFGANAVLRFDPVSERFEPFPMSRGDASVRQMLGRRGEVWAPESGTDHLTVFRSP